VVILSAAQAVALATALGVHVAAARCLSVGEYGTFATAVTLAAALQAFLSGGVPQGIRRLVSVRPGQAAAARRLILCVQVPVCLTGAAALAGAAGPVAALLGAPGVGPALAVLAAEVFLHSGLFDPCLQVLNGAGRHVAQALVSASLHVCRVLAAGVLLWAGAGVPGAAGGLTLAAGVAAALAVLVVWRMGPAAGAAPGRPQPAGALAWLLMASAYEGLTFVLTSHTLWLVKGLVADGHQAGVYAACVTLSRAALALGLAVAGGTYAEVAVAFASGQAGRAGAVLAGCLRAMALVLAPACALTLGQGDGLLELLCGPAYAGSGPLLGVVCLASCGMAAFCLLGEVLAAAGRLRARLALAAGLTALAVPLTAGLTVWHGPGGAAAAFLVTAAVGLGGMGAAARAAVGPFLPWRSLVRVVAAAALALLPSLLLPSPVSASGLAGQAALTVGAYCLALFLLGERLSGR
jgi:O-antigen/teichoic acid export membrane protein